MLIKWLKDGGNVGILGKGLGTRRGSALMLYP